MLRTPTERKKDVIAALEANHDLWVATADAKGRPYLVAMSAWWDGHDVVVATIERSRTAKNMALGNQVRLAAGTPADLVMIDAEVIETVPAAAAGQLGVSFALAVGGWVPDEQGDGWAFFRLRPTRIQAYRGYDELEGRDVMKGGRWLA